MINRLTSYPALNSIPVQAKNNNQKTLYRQSYLADNNSPSFGKSRRNESVHMPVWMKTLLAVSIIGTGIAYISPPLIYKNSCKNEMKQAIEDGLPIKMGNGFIFYKDNNGEERTISIEDNNLHYYKDIGKLVYEHKVIASREEE